FNIKILKKTPLLPQPCLQQQKIKKITRQLRRSLCDAIFSASHPSRTASEHLKYGTCPNFTSPSSSTPALPSPPPRPISSIAPCSSAAHPHHGSHKRSSDTNPLPHSSYHHHYASSLALIDPSRFSSSPTAASAGGDVVYPSSTTPPPHHLHPHLVLSGGEDLRALAMLEDSVKKLKSPKTSPGPALAKAQVDSALSLLSDWFYEFCGAVSLSSAEHPKFRSFGLPPLSHRELASPHLDAGFEEARADVDTHIHDALFFQLSSDGWRPRDATATSDALVSLAANLPNGTSVFHRAVLSYGSAPSKYAEEVLWETIVDVCGSAFQRCAGIIADRFKSKALRNLETQHHWMVNLYCQLQGFHSLIKDFALDVPLFHSVTIKLATIFNTNNPTPLCTGSAGEEARSDDKKNENCEPTEQPARVGDVPQ
ncbi:uncharacterized protein, partial [Elaeis guineensis]|uniref:uncharacterized protein n=1 Tax=Elaeis guineensis var. tenera TaxID=51953 RepID=UPI003C6D8A8F